MLLITTTPIAAAAERAARYEAFLTTCSAAERRILGLAARHGPDVAWLAATTGHDATEVAVLIGRLYEYVGWSPGPEA
jgi:hypothetical protein